MVLGVDSLLPAVSSFQPTGGVFRGGQDLLEDDAVQVTRPASGEDLGEEGYELHVTPARIQVRAATEAGAFYGMQTLRQLWPEVPAGVYRDAPAFPWRGLLLDCCRHFLPVPQVLGVVDRLAMHKMNRLHWHLTEDQGWRLPVDAYPRLAEIAAWREGPDGKPYGGSYTKDEIRQVVAYARERQVLVVPEVEMPGHAIAALAAYPELSCRGKPLAVETRWGIFEDVYCAGNDEVFTFLETVLEETLELFPSPWIHVGGDEVPKTRWKECPRCQARMKSEGLDSAEQLQSWFLGRISHFLADRGRRMVGWDEILEGGLAQGATVQSWRGMDGAIAACRSGHDAIVSPTTHCYLDYDLTRIDLEMAFSFDPVPPDLDPAQRAHILGGECNLWTERAPPETVDCKLFPRMLAIAERLWHGTGGEWEEFSGRARAHASRLRDLGIQVGRDTVAPGTDPLEADP